jgi:hypothetical protein
MTNVEVVTREQLNERRVQLLRRAHMTWDDLRQGAEEYPLTDEQRNAYETIRGIDWQLSAVGPLATVVVS